MAIGKAQYRAQERYRQSPKGKATIKRANERYKRTEQGLVAMTGRLREEEQLKREDLEDEGIEVQGAD
jgi:hypothetical protein